MFSTVSFFLLWIIVAVIAFIKGANFVPILILGGFITFVLVFITWKYLQIEYEYSFSFGIFTVSKIYAKKKRKTLVQAEMKDLLIIAPANDEYIKKAEHFEIEERVIAVSSDKAEDIWLTVTGGKDEKRVLVFFEADERALSILKSSNSFVFVKKK